MGLRINQLAGILLSAAAAIFSPSLKFSDARNSQYQHYTRGGL